jgi:geranylgeranyl diphosphate synthase type II
VIALAPAPDARAGIDDAVGTALARLSARLGDQGDTAAALATALTRATAGGKRFRPALVVAAFEATGGRASETPGLYPVAAAFELLHTAFVVHDDVIDHDTERRGIPNVGGEFRRRARERGADAAGAALLGDAAAILAGDVLLHEATRLVALAPATAEVRADLFDLVDEAVVVSAAGELSDVEHSVVAESAVNADAVLLATANKTAVYSFSAPLEAGAVLAGAPTAARSALRRVGQRLGLAYQLVDDLIGAFGTAELAGRDAGGDLREAKRTALIALARETAGWPEVSDTLAQAYTGPVAVRAAQHALAASGARERLERLIAETLDDARAIASDALLPDEARALVRALVDAVRERIP